MEEINVEANNQEEVYVYLDFHERLAPQIFEKPVFLRIVNLNKAHPLVQINDLIFKGTFDECIGTNLFFEEIEDPPLKTNIYERATPIQLKFFQKQTKLIKLKQIKLPRKELAKPIDSSTAFSFNLDQKMDTVLEKLKEGILNIHDMVVLNVDDKNKEDLNHIKNDDKEVTTEPKKEIETQLNLMLDKNINSVLEAKYERLKRLARRPVRRKQEPEINSGSIEKYQKNYEYNNIECTVLKCCDYFRGGFTPILDKTLVGGVDIDRCVLFGLIEPSNELDRILTNEEIDKVLTLQNIENLSYPARYLVIRETIKIIENSDMHKSEKIDICKILKQLLKALESRMSEDCPSLLNEDELYQISEDDEKDYIKLKKTDVVDFVQNCNTIINDNEWMDIDEIDGNEGTSSKQINEMQYRENWEESDFEESDDDDV